MTTIQGRDFMTERWLRRQAGDDVDDRDDGGNSSLMIAAVAWFSALSRRYESPRRETERLQFKTFIDMLFAGADSVGASAKRAGFTAVRGRELVRWFFEDAFVDLAARSSLSKEDLSAAADLVCAYAKEVQFGVKAETAAVVRMRGTAESEGGVGGGGAGP